MFLASLLPAIHMFFSDLPLIFSHFFCQSSKKDDASEGAGETGSPEKADAEGSSDEDEGALVIDEKSEKGGNKRKVEESKEVMFTHTHTVFGTVGDVGARL